MSESIRLVGMQVCHVDPGMTDEERWDPDLVDAWVCLSRWASSVLRPQVPSDRYVDWIVPNGVSSELFAPRQPGLRDFGDAPRFVYASSPDRGLAHLLRAWPRIRDIWSGATLSIAYGAEAWFGSALASHNVQAIDALDVRDGLSLPGVDYLGKIGQPQLLKLHSRSDALLYPCDTMSPTESGCITIVESMAAGAVVFATDCDSLGEQYSGATVQISLPYDEDAYVEMIRSVMTDPERYAELQRAGYDLAASRDWAICAETWIQLIEREIARRQPAYDELLA